MGEEEGKTGHSNLKRNWGGKKNQGWKRKMAVKWIKKYMRKQHTSFFFFFN